MSTQGRWRTSYALRSRISLGRRRSRAPGRDLAKARRGRRGESPVSAPRDLFGDPIPQSEGAIVRQFIQSVRSHGAESFNAFRARRGIGRVSKHIGAVVRADCGRAGLVRAGTATAKIPASHGRLCQTWGAAK